MIGSELTVLHVDSAREFRGGQNQARLLMAGLRDVPAVRQALVAGEGSRLAAIARDMGVQVWPVAWEAAADARALRALLSHVSDSWDVVHAHDGHGVQAALLARALSGARTRVVASRRVDFPPRSPAMWRRADLVITVSARIREILLDKGIERRRLRVVRSGIDPTELTPGGDGARPGDLRRAAGAGEEELLVAAVGALVPHKDHRTFVAAAARLAESRPTLRFAVFGEGPERSALERAVRNAGLDRRFALPGEIRGAARALADIDVFVMPSKEEGLGTACIEAMASGRPIVATGAGGLRELAVENAFHPVEPERPAELAAEIDRLVSSEEERHAAGRRAESAARHFSARSMVQGTLACYRAVARGPS